MATLDDSLLSGGLDADAASAAVDAVTILAGQADAVVSHVGFALSDFNYVLPSAGEHLGAHAETWASRGGSNAFGDRGEVKTLQTRAGVGGVLVGTLAAGHLAAAYAPSAALPLLQKSIASLSSQRLPGVVHVLGRAVASDTSLSAASDHASLLASSQATGAALLVSSSLQEAHDLAVIAHAAAIKTRSPVIHAVDGSAVADAIGSVRVLRYHELAAAVDAAAVSAHRFGSASPSSAAAPSLASLDAVMQSLAPVLGKRYRPVEYTGHSSPKVVVVAIGAGAATAAAVAQRLSGDKGERVGVVRILAVSPWSPAALAAAIPQSATTVAVLSFSPAWAPAQPSLLFKQVAAAVGGNRQTLEWTVADDGTFGPRHAASLFARLTAGGNVPSKLVFETGAPLADAPLLMLPKQSPPASSPVSGLNSSLGLTRLLLQVPVKSSSSTASASRRIRVWGLAHDGSASIAKASAKILAGPAGNSANSAVSGSFLSGRYEHGAVSVATVTSGGAAASAADGDDGVDAVVVSHMSLLTSFDVLGPLRHGGIVVLNATPAVPINPTDGSAANAATMGAAETIALLSDADKHLLATREAKVFVINAGAVAAAHKLGGHEAVVLQTALFLARGQAQFANVASLLESQHRAALSTDKHGSLVRMYAALRSALTSVAVPVAEWSKLSAHDKSGRASLPAAILPPSSTADDADAAIASALSTPGLGPSDWSAPRSMPTTAAAASASSVTSPAAAADAAYLKAQHRAAALSLAFPDAFGSVRQALPTEHGVHIATVTVNRRLTPLEYDRNVFHIEFDITGTGLKYEIGSALGVFGQNEEAEVDDFLAWYGLDPSGIVTYDVPQEGDHAHGPPHKVVQSIRRLFVQDLDLLGKPGKEFYESLAKYATNAKESAELALLGSDAGVDEYSAREKEGVNYADCLRDFPSARPPIEVLISIIPRIKPRHYSIASSMKMHPNSVHLLVVEVDWTTPQGRKRFGQCSHYLAGLRPGQKTAVHVMSSEMLMPADPKAPIIMAGLGTGMAPFMAFIQERAWQRKQGIAVGPMVLYFGSRFKAMEYLYGEELEEFAASGLVTLRLAFSRDGPKKVYIQHLMNEDSDRLWSLLQVNKGSFYLCGPTWPEPDVEEAITKAFAGSGGLGREGGSALIRSMKEAKRYVLEVY